MSQQKRKRGREEEGDGEDAGGHEEVGLPDVLELVARSGYAPQTARALTLSKGVHSDDRPWGAVLASTPSASEKLLTDVIKKGDMKRLEELLRAGSGKLLNPPAGAPTVTPLGIACLEGTREVVELLLDRGAKVDRPHVTQFPLRGIIEATPLMLACARPEPEIVELLLQRGADPLQVVNSHVALQFALDFVPIDPIDDDGKSARLHDIVRMLLDRGADVAHLPRQRDVLEFATRMDWTDVAQHCIARGLPMHTERRSVLSFCRSLQMAQLLLNAGEHAEPYGANDERNPLIDVCSSSAPEVVAIARLLLDRGAHAGVAANHAGPLHDACSNRRLGNDAVPLVRLLLQRGADPRAPDNLLKTPLHHAASGGRRDVTQLLLQRGADADLQSRTGNGLTPLHSAVSALDPGALEALLERGAFVEANDNKGETALHKAAKRFGSAQLKALLLHGANARARTYDDDTPLHFAARRCDKEACELLLKHGAGISARNHSGQTPFHFAAEGPAHAYVFDELRIDIFQTLVRHGADIHAKDEEGNTPLHLAAFRKHPEAVEELLRIGAWSDLVVANKNGKRPMDGRGGAPLSPSVLAVMMKYVNTKGLASQLQGGASRRISRASPRIRPRQAASPRPASPKRK